MNKIDVYALCVKIMLFLNKNSCLSKSNLLYFISLSDFYVDGSMQNNNIKNINSFKFYSSQMNNALAILLATKLIEPYGYNYKLTASGSIFTHNFSDNRINQKLTEKIDYIQQNYVNETDLEKIYNELTIKFIESHIGGCYEN